jgi:hypothetical protein
VSRKVGFIWGGGGGAASGLYYLKYNKPLDFMKGGGISGLPEQL